MKISRGFRLLTTCIAVITFGVCVRPAAVRPTAALRSSMGGGQSTQRYHHRPEEYYDEEYDDDDEDYPEGEQYREPDPESMINCYSCHYQNERGYAQGSVNCKEPFAPGQIAIVKCAGPCAKIFRTLDVPGEFMISRNCVPKCKDIQSSKGYTDCCSSHLCNGAIGTGRYRRRTIASVAVMLLCCLVLALT